MRTFVLLLAALLLGAEAPAAQQRIDETVRTAADGRVEIHNVAGSVQVSGWNRGEIRVTGELGRGAERVQIDTRGGTTEIRVVIPRDARNARGTDLQIRVPAGKEVMVRTTSAEIQVEDVTGIVEAVSTSGDVVVRGRPARVGAGSTSGDVRVDVSGTTLVRARSTSGDIQVSGTVRESVDAETTSGDLDVSAETPEVRAKSVSGDLDLRGVGGRVSASTVSGDAQIAAGSIQYGSFETVSGTLRFEGAVQRGGAFNLQSHSGDVELILPRDVGADFEVSTFSGDIHTDFGVRPERRSRHGPGMDLRFTSGRGGALITVKTFSGEVRLRRR